MTTPPWIRRIALLTGLTLLASLLGLTSPALTPTAYAVAPPAGTGASYVYDSAGRLVTVISTTGELARYSYDSAGNITAIARSTAPATGVIDANPRSAAPGKPVTIFGRGFSTVPAQTSVSIGGTKATITSASATQLQVTVPAGAKTGPLSVTATGITYTSDWSFTVAPPPPAISNLSASIITPGSTLAINGTGFQSNSPSNNIVSLAGVRLPVTQATSTRLSVSIPTLARSGTLRVATPYGSTTTRDVYIPPSNYTPADVGPTGRLATSIAKPVSFAQPNLIGMFLFDASAGQKLSLDITNNTTGGSYLDVLTPQGTQLYSSYASSDLWTDALTAPTSGTYTVVVDPNVTNTGSLNLTLKNIPADSTGTLTPGTGVQVNFTAAGQNAVRTFTGTAGQRVSLEVTNNTVGGTYLNVLKPDGTTLSSLYAFADAWTDALTLPATGTYTVALDPSSTNIGSLTLSLSTIPADTTGTLNMDTTTTISFTTPGQNATRTFTATAGQRVSLEITTNTTDGAYLNVLAPTGASLGTYYAAPDMWSDAITLPATGTYTVLIDPRGKATGTLNLSLASVPQDSTGALTLGTPTGVSFTAPGQNAVRTFTATAGQRISAAITASTLGALRVSVHNPDGSGVTSSYFSGNSVVETPELTRNGTYFLVIDPAGKSTGTLTLTATRMTGTARTGAAPAPAPTPEPTPKTPPLIRRQQGEEPLPHQFRPREGKTWRSPKPGQDWSTNREASPWEKPVLYTADSALPALSGRVLSVDGLPLAGARLTIGPRSTTSDATGRWLLPNVRPGHHQMDVEAGSTYGRYEIGVEVNKSGTTYLPFTIWMTQLDRAHQVKIPAKITKHTVISNPAVPGLEVHLPAGSWVNDEEGKPVRELGITAIPVDRAPFPLPLLGVQVPMYFTVQPGGYVYPDGAQIYYPNSTNAAPNQRVEFYNYDPKGKGWYIYGHGRVTADGLQVRPDKDVGVWEFTGAMFNAGDVPPDDAPPPGGCSTAADPVDCATGLYVDRQTDLSLGDAALPIEIERTYRTNDTDSRSFGIGSQFNFDLFLWSAQQYQEVDLVLPDGAKIHYPRTSPGTGYTDAIFTTGAGPTRFAHSTITRNNQRSGWDLRLTDGTNLYFPQYTPVTEITNRYGEQLIITRNPNKQATQITTSASGRWVQLQYDSAGRITTITDLAGRSVRYSYDPAGRLASVTDPLGRITSYTYDSQSRRLTRVLPSGITAMTNTYDTNGRVSTQKLADGSTYQFAYALDEAGAITKTTVTNPRGVKTERNFNASGYLTSQVEAVGTALSRRTSFTRDNAARLTSVTDALGRQTAYRYDSRSNLISTTTLAGTTNATTHSTVYESTWNQPTSTTDALGRRTTFSYNSRGALIGITNPLGARTSITTDTKMRPIAITDPLGNATRFAYQLGDLSTATDASGRTSRRFVDTLGRTSAATNGAGGVSLTQFDAADQVLALTNPAGQKVTLSYTSHGLLRTLTDPRGASTTFTYDTRNRLTRRTDPLGRSDTVTYDRNGNTLTATDRRGVVASSAYDALDRPTSTQYGNGLRDAFTYDAGDRLRTAASTPAAASGTLTRTYDGHDRLLSETSAQGSISSTYDKVGNRLSTTVAGQPSVSYSYDAANRLTTLQRSGATLSYTYDQANRPTKVTLPNGVSTAYSFDRSGQLTGLTYAKGSTALGSLGYSYDANGARQRLFGSMARADLPPALSSAAYDSANRLTRWGTQTLSYDNAGNLTGDGSRTYSWNPRGQLARVTGSGTVPAASYGYDPLGRRVSTQIGSTSTQYLHDGIDPVAELSGGTVRATLLTGPYDNQVFGRFDAGAASYFLTDALGSTVAVTNAAGSVATSYGYDPYGATSTSGAASANRNQYTGRQNDGNGLYYLRARYYNPQTSRFLSEDPIGFAGGDANLYAYVGGSPTNATDPSGTIWQWMGSPSFWRGVVLGVELMIAVAGGLKSTPPSMKAQQQRQEQTSRVNKAGNTERKKKPGGGDGDGDDDPDGDGGDDGPSGTSPVPGSGSSCPLPPNGKGGQAPSGPASYGGFGPGAGPASVGGDPVAFGAGVVAGAGLTVGLAAAAVVGAAYYGGTAAVVLLGLGAVGAAAFA